MQLRNPYPENVALNLEGDEAWAEFKLPENYPYFNGHFPGNPIVPAVVQIAWGLVAIEFWREAALGDYRLSRFKFILPIKPCMLVKLMLAKSQSKYVFRLSGNDELCSSGNISLID